jgi:UDP:flavonoid glycosyltransferase YjiC (YdhE family)
VLLVTWEGGGNVPPAVVLARTLVERGHDVQVLGPPGAVEARFRAEGVGYRASGATVPWRPEAHHALAAQVVDQLGPDGADVAVVDYMQPSALCGAEAAGVPVVPLVHTLFRDLSPMYMAADVEGTNAVRVGLGLAPVARLAELVERAPLVLVTTLEELDRPQLVAGNVRYVGPLVEDAGPDEGWRPPGRPLVVVSLGTTPMGEAPVLQRVLDGLDGAPVQVLATLGPHLSAQELQGPANTTLTGYLRHAAVLPHADVCVNHAGLGSIGAALTFGVPLVCLPLGRDQPANAEAVAAARVGRVVAPDAPADHLRATVLGVLADVACRRNAARLADRIRALDGPTRAAEAIESLLR